MNDTITITSKGQTTLPVSIRRKLGLDESGGVLQARFDEARGEFIITKIVTVDELADRASKYLNPGIKPLKNVDEYYQKYRRDPRV